VATENVPVPVEPEASDNVVAPAEPAEKETKSSRRRGGRSAKTPVVEEPAPAPVEVVAPAASSATEEPTATRRPARSARRGKTATTAVPTSEPAVPVSEPASSSVVAEVPPSIETTPCEAEAPSATAKPVISEEMLAQKTVVQLKAELKKYGLQQSGLKAELVTRLAAHLNSL
jgi:hypothetical protein